MKKRFLVANALAEFSPIIAFIIASEIYGFFNGISILVVVTVLAISFEWYVARRIPKFGLVAAWTILIFSGISLATHNEFFIIIKDTLYPLSFGLALLLGVLFGRYYLKVLFGDFFAMTDRGWKILTQRWIIFFFLLAIGNELVRNHLTPEVWLYYKFASMIVLWFFGFYQFTLARKERLPEANEWGLRI